MGGKICTFLTLITLFSPCRLAFDRLIASCKPHKSWINIVVAKIGSLDWVTIITVLLQADSDHSIRVLDWRDPPAPVGGPTQTFLCFFVRD